MVEEWRIAALCAQVDAELFYPDVGESVRPALRICGRCENWVREACLTDALDVELRLGGEPSGVRGGKTARERAAILRQRRAEAREAA